MSATYVFRAVDALGVKHKGEVEAESPPASPTF